MSTNESVGFAFGGAMITMILVFSLLGLAYYVWYLWSLSRLFPKLGLPSWAGWVPLWNQWQLIQRGGLPGWLVLLGLIPGLSIVVLVVSIIAIHRIDTEHGKSAGFTVLGAFIPPLWATLLANDLRRRAYGGPVATAQQPVGAPQPYAASQPYGAPQSYAAPQPTEAQPAPGALGYQGLPPVPPQAFAPPTFAPPEPQARPGSPAPQVPETHLPPAAGAPADLPPAPVPPAPAAPSPVPPAPAPEWNRGNTPENDYERLASEAPQARRSEPLGGQEPVRPFSWPGPDEPAAPLQLPEPQQPPAVADESEVFDLDDLDRSERSIFDPAPTAESPVQPVSAATSAESAQHAADVVAETPSDEPVESDEADDDFDRTVVVVKRARWGIELPDGELLEVPDDVVVVGRKPQPIEGSAVLQISDPTRTVSKSHLRMRQDGETWLIEDLQSTNGLSLVGDDGELTQLEPGIPTPATERFVIGTLEVRLRRL